MEAINVFKVARRFIDFDEGVLKQVFGDGLIFDDGDDDEKQKFSITSVYFVKSISIFIDEIANNFSFNQHRRPFLSPHI